MSSSKVNQIFIGEVSSVQNYGAFVRIPGCTQQGLVHRSQVSSAPVDDVAEVLQRGERVWCKIISIGDDGKIALSMKLVNQGNGQDLDPNGVQLQLDDQKRKKMNTGNEKKIIVLDAIYNTTCSKCKTPGHLAKDCFTTPGGKKYELLPEIEDEEPVPQPPTEPTIKNESKPKEKKHKSKKSVKRKKSKSSKQKDLDDEDNDSSDEKSKKKRKMSKEQKHKKRKHHDSSSDSDSSDSSVSSYENKKHSKKCKHSRVKHSH